MSIDNRNFLIFIAIFSICLIPLRFYLSGVTRIILMLPLFLFFPGYVLLNILFPGKNSLSNFERLVFSICISITIVPCLGLILNFTALDLTAETMIICTAVLVLALLIPSYLLSLRLSEEKRLRYDITPIRLNISGTSTSYKAIYFLVVLAIFTAIGVLSYIIISPFEGEKYTEFYILGPDRTALNFPSEVRAGSQINLIAGIKNNEYITNKYRVEIRMEDRIIAQYTTIDIKHSNDLEMPLYFTPVNTGDGQKVEFLLYKNADLLPCSQEPLRLFLNVHSQVYQ